MTYAACTTVEKPTFCWISKLLLYVDSYRCFPVIDVVPSGERPRTGLAAGRFDCMYPASGLLATLAMVPKYWVSDKVSGGPPTSPFRIAFGIRRRFCPMPPRIAVFWFPNTSQAKPNRKAGEKGGT